MKDWAISLKLVVAVCCSTPYLYTYWSLVMGLSRRAGYLLVSLTANSHKSLVELCLPFTISFRLLCVCYSGSFSPATTCIHKLLQFLNCSVIVNFIIIFDFPTCNFFEPNTMRFKAVVFFTEVLNYFYYFEFVEIEDGK